MTLQELLTRLTRELQAAGTDAPALEARLLAGHVLRLDRIGLMLVMPAPVDEAAARAIRALTARRCAGEPLAHITGRREFFGRDFAVSPQTLIPRPETELLLEIVLRENGGREDLRFADLGAGTGCIGITLALELPRSRGLLLEYSAAALPVTARNIRDLGAGGRLALVRGDMFAPPLLPRCLDLLVSNPPYIAAAEENEVMAEVLRHEPHGALFSEDDGLRHLRAVAAAGRQALRSGGLLAVEHGYRQGAAVRGLLADAGFPAPRTEQDLAGLDRCTWARLA